MMAKTVGAAAAVMPARGTMTHHRDQAFELVEGVNEYDVDAFGISLAGRCILSYIRVGGQKARPFIVLSCSQSAVIGISNPNSRSIQEHALNFAYIIILARESP